MRRKLSEFAICNRIRSIAYELVQLCTRRTQSSWPVFASLANHSNAARNSKWGKALVTMIDPPEREEGQGPHEYSICSNMFFLRVYEKILDLINNWKGGFYMRLPGYTPPGEFTLVVPRVGLFLGDLLEQRLLSATSQWHSARCVTQVQFKFGSAGVKPNLAAEFDIAKEMATVPKVEEVWMNS